MLKEYKVFVIDGLYNTIPSSGPSFREWMGRRFVNRFGVQPDKIEVLQEDKYTKGDSPSETSWIGKLTLNLTIDGETYSITRDWEKELEHDIKHPCYNDDYFYESESCHSYKTRIELLRNLND